MPNVKSFNDLGHFGNLLAEVRIIIVKWVFREEDILNYKNIYPFINLYDQSFASVVQYDKVENGRRKIASCCENMTATYLGSPLQRLAHFVSRKDKCLKNNYEKFVTLYRNETWDAQSDISKHITIKIACVNYLLFIILFFFTCHYSETVVLPDVHGIRLLPNIEFNEINFWILISVAIFYKYLRRFIRRIVRATSNIFNYLNICLSAKIR